MLFSQRILNRVGEVLMRAVWLGLVFYVFIILSGCDMKKPTDFEEAREDFHSCVEWLSLFQNYPAIRDVYEVCL